MPDTAGQKLRASRLRTIENTDIFNTIGGGTIGGTASATYVDVAGASKSITKVAASADSDLIVLLSVSCFVSVAGTVVRFGVRVNGVDIDMTQMPVNAAAAHTPLPMGATRITGLAAGAYTVQVRVLRVSGTGTITVDVNDTVSLYLEERAK